MGRAFSFPLPEVIVSTKAATVRLGGNIGRLSLRARGDLSSLNAALGVTLPAKIGDCAKAGDLEVVCLGPDEWLLLMPQGLVADISAKMAEVYASHPHSLADISNRELSFDISGPKAAELITLGCPRDIDAFPVGSARRTVFDGASVVLWRDAEDHFRMDVWNSFAPFAAQTLDTGGKELAVEMA